MILLPLLLAALAVGGAAGWWLRARRNAVAEGTLAAGVPAMEPEPAPDAAAERGAVILLDVDDLAAVNRSEGFDAGDRLLGRIGDVMARALTGEAMLETLENGRFAVWMPRASLSEAEALALRLRGVAGRTVVVGRSSEISRTVSAGIGLYPGPGMRARALLHADAVLEQAKRLGGDRQEVDGTPAQLPGLSTRAEVAGAIERGELAYHLQPIVDLSQNRTVGNEALLRWRRRDGRTVGPDQFVDQIDRIPAAGVDLIPDLAMSAVGDLLANSREYVTFNVTGAMLDGTDGPGGCWLRNLIECIPPDRLVLEIVESAVLLDVAQVTGMLEGLRGRGIRIALDDFGTGLSNLERLRSLPADILKIDGAFVRGLNTNGREEAILQAVGEMAADLGLDLVAEGVETRAQADALRRLGVRYGQGWHFGAPKPKFSPDAGTVPPTAF